MSNLNRILNNKIWNITTCILIFSILVLAGCGGSNSSDVPGSERDGSTVISAVEGGVIQFNNEVTFTVPPESLENDTAITIERVTTIPSGESDGISAFGQAYRFLPKGTTFELNNPAILEIRYDDSALKAKGFNPETTQICYFDEEMNRFVPVNCVVDTVAKTITAQVEHFTVYLPMAKALLPTNNAPYIGNQTPVPNPIRAGAPIYIRSTVRDYDGSIAGVKLYYRKLKPTPGAWQEARMVKEVNHQATLHTYGYLIPASFLTAADLGTGNDFEYKVEATDNLGAKTTSTTRSFNVTRTYQAGSINVNPSTLDITAGFERALIARGVDSSAANFNLIPEIFNLSDGSGTVTNRYAQGILYQAKVATPSGSPEHLNVGFGTEATSCAINVYNGELDSIEILDTNGIPFSGDLIVSEGTVYEFDVVGHDAFGNTIPVIPAWGADPVVGIIDANGKLDTTACDGTGVITASLLYASDTHNVVVQSRAKEITSFSINGENGVISFPFITVTQPWSSDVKNLIATFSITGQNVTVNSVIQESGVTPNDFTNPVIYRVTAEDGSSQDYTVKVKKLSPFKDITEFSIMGSKGLVKGAIGGTNINIALPKGTDPSTLVATYSTTGQVIRVNGIIQFSGVTSNDFTNPVTYKVSAEDGTEKSYLVRVNYINGIFPTAIHYSTDVRPYCINSGDFNGDGVLDLVVANFGSNDVSILLGNSNGTFQSAVNYSTGTQPYSVTAGDFNGDGALDLAVANYGNNTVSILRGNGNGTFQSAVNIAAGSQPHCIIARDFNNDGALDLAVANGGSVNILRGNGNGTFQAGVNYSTGVGSWCVIDGDFNGDGALDLAVANNASNNVSILLGNGNCTFQSAVNYTSGSSPSSIAAGDLNNDGKLDLVVTNLYANTVRIIMGNGDGTFSATVNYSTGTQPYSVSAGDFNNDGSIDLAVVNKDGNTVSILIGNGNGTFQPQVRYATGLLPYCVITGDYNGDGVLDLAVANYDSNNISILLGKGNGSFRTAVIHSAGSMPEGVDVGDFNGDGLLDLAVADAGPSYQISILIGNGNGTFQTVVTYPLGSNNNIIKARDFNNDGVLDLAVLNISSNYVSIFIGNGNGTFQTAVNYTTVTYPSCLTIGDFNGDGVLDFVVGSNTNTIMSILLGNGNGTFQATVNYTIGTTLSGITIGDFNSDGVLDLAATHFSSNSVGLYLGNGNGTFQVEVNYATGSNPNRVIAGDFNNDGVLDLAVANFGSNDMSILSGNGNGTFQSAVNYTAGIHPRDVINGDFNGDGALDLAITNWNSHDVSVYHGIGNGLFQSAVNYATGSSPVGITAGDFNGDGALDLITAGHYIDDGGISIIIAQ